MSTKGNKMIQVNISELLKINHNLMGFVGRITSPKATRKIEENGGKPYKVYSFKTAYALMEDGICYLKKGIYQALDVCHWNNTSQLQWNAYLIVVDEEGARVVAQYLDSPDTKWVIPARSIVKAYYNDEYIDSIEVIPQPEKETRKRSWSSKDYDMNVGTFTDTPIKTSKKTEDKTTKKKSKKLSSKQVAEDSKKVSATNNILKKKTRPGREQDKESELAYGTARLMTFTGMVIGVYKILRFNKKYIEIQADKGVLRFFKEDGKQVNAKNPRYANKIQFNLDKSTRK